MAASADAAPLFDRLDRLLATAGLLRFGQFHPAPADAVPAPSGGGAADTLVLVGNAGPDMWRAFRRDRPGGQAEAEADPLDGWTRDRVDRIAGALGAEAAYPFGGPPWLPFQRWARRAGAFHGSPLGLLIHPDHGLWVALRGALVLAERLPLPEPDRRPSPCDGCREKPCLSACPVDAFACSTAAAPRYAVAACRAHIAGPDGADCRSAGCRARRACPVAPEAAWPADQARFHMDAFAGARPP